MLLGLMLYSCKSTPDVSKLNIDIRKCLEVRSKKISDGQVNLFNSYQKIEEKLIKEDFLKDNTKSSYYKLFNEFEKSFEGDIESTQKYIILYKLINNDIENYYLINSISSFLTPFECNRFMIEKNSLNTSEYYSDYYSVLMRFVNSDSISDWALNNELLNSTPDREFSNIIYRTPIISLIYENLKYQFENKEMIRK